MALTLCKSCGKRVSDQWPECPACGTIPGENALGRPHKKRSFNPAPHYLIGTTLSTIGAFVYGAQLIGQGVNSRMMTVGVVLIALGVCWYAAARMLAAMR